MIRIDRPFLLYANCSIIYNGRAKSDLKVGNYIIIRKGDGALMIHGATKMVPLNYQPPGAIMTRAGNKLISKRNQEIIEININLILQFSEIDNWDDNKAQISMTENDLSGHIIDHIDNLIGEKITEVHREFKTPVGPVDIIAIGTIYHIIEVKRGKASLAACAQLERYSGYFTEIKQDHKAWLMSPEISINAALYCQKRNLFWKRVHHHQSHEATSSTDPTATHYAASHVAHPD